MPLWRHEWEKACKGISSTPPHHHLSINLGKLHFLYPSVTQVAPVVLGGLCTAALRQGAEPTTTTLEEVEAQAAPTPGPTATPTPVPVPAPPGTEIRVHVGISVYRVWG